MPRVFEISDAQWDQAFKTERHEINFRQDDSDSWCNKRYAEIAKSCNKLFLENIEAISRKAWRLGGAISLSATLAPFSDRLKRSSATTSIESFEYYSYAITNALYFKNITLSQKEVKKIDDIIIETSMKIIARIPYYYAATLAASRMVDARSAHRAVIIFGDTPDTFATNQFNSVRHFFDELLINILKEHIQINEDNIKTILHDYNPDIHRQLSPKEKANIRKRINRLIDKIPKDELAFEIGFFISNNCAYKTWRKSKIDQHTVLP